MMDILVMNRQWIFFKRIYIRNIFYFIEKEKYWWDILSKILFDNQHIEKSNYIKINNLLTDIGCQFKVEERISSNLMDMLRQWTVTDKTFPFNRNKAFYFLAKKWININHYKKSRMLDIVTSLSDEKRNFSYF